MLGIAHPRRELYPPHRVWLDGIPITFRHPALLARMAAAVDDLSGGRLILGLGAGWQEREHHNFGIRSIASQLVMPCSKKA